MAGDIARLQKFLRQVSYYSWGAAFLCLLFAVVGYSFPALTDYFTGAEGSLQEKREVIAYSAAQIFLWIAVVHVFSSLIERALRPEKKDE